MNDFPADWAIERALEPVNAAWKEGGISASSVEDVKTSRGLGAGLAVSILAHARLIEKHEKPPVDPDLLLAREIVAVVVDEVSMHVSGDDYRGGSYDNECEVVAILKLLKERGK